MILLPGRSKAYRRDRIMENVNQVTGRIFDIQRYSIHDGPGIRTIVFLKGCVLRCKWCCNPESQEFGIQTMNVDGKDKIIGRDVTVAEVMDTIRRDIPYYRRSNGGMTLSGGESLCQPEFAKALFEGAHHLGINTAIESTGYAKFEIIETLLPDIDYFLMDIKHMDAEKHEKFTGKRNELVLENARKIAASGVNLTIRVPVIPGFNCKKTEIRQIADFAASLPEVKEIHLLPYHRLGQDKYAGLSRDYALLGVEPIPADHMNELKQEAEKSGLHCQIGG